MVLSHIFYSQLRKYVASRDYHSPHLSVNCGDIVTPPTTTALDYLGSKSKVYIVFIDILLHNQYFMSREYFFTICTTIISLTEKWYSQPVLRK